jgi:hypothetical protein
MSESKDFRIFYSWQSDLPKKTNLNAIRNANKEAAKNLEKKHLGTKFIPDEATRDTSGSPNIALKILEKIECSDAFIADITTITPEGSLRPCPNPNVSYELGYAASQLGWDRIVLLFNENFGNFPADLPFDLIQQRASPYRLSEEATRAEHKNLVEFVEVAIEAIFEKNPKTPVELRGLPVEKILHERDVENMNWLMSTLHIPSLDHHIDEIPRCISDRIFFFWESFKGVANNSLFSLYDEKLGNYVGQLFHAWQTTLSFVGRYRYIPGHRTTDGRSIFSNPGDAPLDRGQEKDWDEIESARDEMYTALQGLLAHLRKDYLEVNIKHTNMKAWEEYKTTMKESVEKL